VTPLAHAMGFVNGDSSKFPLRMYCSKELSERIQLTVFRRDVEETSQRVAALQVFVDSFLGARRCGAVDCFYSNIRFSHRSHLIVLSCVRR